MYPLSILLNIFLFLAVSLILLSFGSKILKLFRFDFASKVLKFLISFGLGLGLFGYLLYIIGLLSLFYFWLIWVLIIIVGLCSYREIIIWLVDFKNVFKRFHWSILKKDKWLLVIIILILLWLGFVFVGTVSPMIEFDSRWYHFGEAKYYLENHRISIETFWAGVHTPSVFWPSAFPRLAEMFFAIFLSFKAEIAAKLVNFAFGLIGVLAIFYYARRKVGNYAAIIAAAVVLVSEPFIINSLYGYIDLIVFGFSALFLLLLFLWFEKQDIKNLILAGVFCGLVISTKFNGVLLLPIAFFLIVWQGIAQKNLKQFLINNLYFFFFTLLFSFAWYLDNKLHTGSFIYPFGGLISEARSQLGILKTEMRLFLDLIIFISPFFIFTFFFGRKKSAKIDLALLSSFLIYFVIWGTISTNEFRYLLPGMFGLCVLAGQGFAWFRARRIMKYMAVTFVVMLLLVGDTVAFLKVKSYLPYFIGLKTREEFLTRVMAPDWWTVYDYNGEIKRITGGKKVLIAGNAGHTYYIDFPAKHASLSGINFIKIDRVVSLNQVLKENGFDYVLVKKGDMNQLFYFTTISDKDNSDRYFPKIYDDSYSEITIYQVK